MNELKKIKIIDFQSLFTYLKMCAKIVLLGG